MISERLAGKIVLVTNGTDSVGEVIAQRSLEEGATVVITGYDQQKLHNCRDQLVSRAGGSSERVTPILLAGKDAKQIGMAVSEITTSLGRIDVLINIAGELADVSQVRETPASVQSDLYHPGIEILRNRIGSLLGVPWHMIRRVVPYMQSGSAIINVLPFFSHPDYCERVSCVVPQAALNTLSLHLARDLEPRGIRVNTVYPGLVDSRVGQGAVESYTQSVYADSVDGAGTEVRGWPQATDIAQTVVFLGSDESAALNGQTVEVIRGMDVPYESSTTFVSRPELRTIDASGKLILVSVGDQVEDALALTGVLRSLGAEVVLGFRSRSAISRVEEVLQESQRLQGPSYTPPSLAYLNPLEPSSIEAVLTSIQEQFGALDGVIMIPAYGPEYVYPTPIDADVEVVTQFLEQEITGTLTLAGYLAHFWSDAMLMKPSSVIFMSNGDDGRGNVYADMLRAGIEQLVRLWRYEPDGEITDGQVAKIGAEQLPLWANQIVRYVNSEDENLEFACAWAAKLLNGDRHIDEINLYLPKRIAKTTGARRPSFGWAEALLGQHLGKVALITGGSAGIGGQIGRLLALSGAHVLLAARGAGQLEQLRERILRELHEIGYANADSRVQILAGIDVADESELQRLFDYTINTFGRVDYLINNAGIAGIEEMVIDMPLDGWNRTLQANLISNFSLMRKIAPLMKAQGSGYILNVSSYFGGEKYVAVPYPNRADYAVSKAGQRALVEALARFMGPEVQINALAPGPVEGDRLRGTGERPGLFMRRARLIMENKRLNEVHAAIVTAHRDTNQPIIDILKVLMSNGVQALGYDKQLPAALQHLVATIWDQGDPQGSARAYLLSGSIGQKLVRRLEVGKLLEQGDGELFLANLPEPPIPFFTRAQIEREARKVRDGVLGMLYLQRMPTEFDVAMATVYYLADRNVSGETFHPSGGLKFERTVTEGELFGKAGQHRLEQLRGMTVFLIGEHLRSHLIALAQTYLEEYDVGRVVFLTD